MISMFIKLIGILNLFSAKGRGKGKMGRVR